MVSEKHSTRVFIIWRFAKLVVTRQVVLTRLSSVATMIIVWRHASVYCDSSNLILLRIMGFVVGAVHGFESISMTFLASTEKGKETK